MYNLNIYFHSLEFRNNLVALNEKIKICIFTNPDCYKKSIIIKDTDKIIQSISINISEKIREILFVFKKIETDQIFASTIVHVSQLPQTLKDDKNNELQTISIYEPIHYIQPENITLYGYMIVRFTICNLVIEKNKIKMLKILVDDENDDHNNNLVIFPSQTLD